MKTIINLKETLNVNCLILMRNKTDFQYLKADKDATYYLVDLFETYQIDEEFDKGFPTESGIYEAVVDFTIDDEWVYTKVQSFKKAYDL